MCVFQDLSCHSKASSFPSDKGQLNYITNNFPKGCRSCTTLINESDKGEATPTVNIDRVEEENNKLKAGL